MHVLIVGNSVSEPPGDDIPSYPQRLQTMTGGHWTIDTIIRGGATLDDFEDEVIRAIEAAKPRAVVLQVGINECAPRPLGRAGRARLSRLRPLWLRQRIISLIHNYRPRLIRARGVVQLTSPADFSAAVRRVLDAARRAGSSVLILPITRIPAPAEARTPFTNREVARYNAILATFAGTDVRATKESELFGDVPPEEYCAGPQTVHLAPFAHEVLAKHIATWLASMVPSTFAVESLERR